MVEQGSTIRFLTYSQYHGKNQPVGSDYLRVHQLIKYWDGAELYKYGENPDVLIFTKVFVTPDYKFPIHFKGFKILDICDPMWLEGFNIVESSHAMDAVTTSTEELAKFVRQFHSNVVVVPDRFDLELIPQPKTHRGKAKSVVWFGYSHNIDTLKPAYKLIKDLGLKLIIISNDDPLLGRMFGEGKYQYIKYDELSIYQDIQLGDFGIFPDGMRPVDRFKSNNKTIRANLAGLPVAKTADEMRNYMYPEKRREWLLDNYDKIKQEYDINLSIKQYKNIINKAK